MDGNEPSSKKMDLSIKDGVQKHIEEYLF